MSHDLSYGLSTFRHSFSHESLLRFSFNEATHAQTLDSGRACIGFRRTELRRELANAPKNDEVILVIMLREQDAWPARPRCRRPSGSSQPSGSRTGKCDSKLTQDTKVPRSRRPSASKAGATSFLNRVEAAEARDSHRIVTPTGGPGAPAPAQTFSRTSRYNLEPPRFAPASTSSIDAKQLRVQATSPNAHGSRSSATSSSTSTTSRATSPAKSERSVESFHSSTYARETVGSGEPEHTVTEAIGKLARSVSAQPVRKVALMPRSAVRGKSMRPPSVTRSPTAMSPTRALLPASIVRAAPPPLIQSPLALEY